MFYRKCFSIYVKITLIVFDRTVDKTKDVAPPPPSTKKKKYAININ